MRSVITYCVALLWTVAVSVAGQNVNLVQNPNFEVCDADQNPASWRAQVVRTVDYGYGCSSTEQFISGDARSIYYVPSGIVELQQTVTLVPGQQYTVSVDYAYFANRCPEADAARAVISLSLGGAQINALPTFDCDTSATLVTLSGVVNYPAGAPSQASLQVQATFDGDGYLVFRNAQVVGPAPSTTSMRARLRRKRIEAGKIDMPVWA